MTTIPLLPQPQQVSSDSILINRLDELEKHIVNWAMHAPLRERFRDLPELLSDLAEARKKKKKRQGSPKTPSGLGLHLILHHQQVPLELQEPLALLGRLNHHLLLHLYPTIRVVSLQATLPQAPQSQLLWLNIRLKAPVSPIPEELHMDDDTTADEQAYSSSGEEVRRDHIPTINLRQSWWKPHTEDRLAT
ncbi:hypothetical protein Tco_1390742, partial [Tanacetum coccineum]